MAFGRARHLSNVEGDEISPVRRAANKRRFLLRKEDGADEIDDILSVPAENEGALLDLVRKDGVDETVEEAVTMTARLLAAIGPDLSRETIEKLGSQMYAQENRPLNTGHGMAGETLNGEMGVGPNPKGGTPEPTDNDPEDIDEDDDNYDTDSPADLAAVGKDDMDDDDDDVKKRAFSADERKNLASRGQAESDGSYPIANRGDLKNAVQAFGRSKNKGKTKSHIIARAKALGATSMLPDSWTVTKGAEFLSPITTTTSSGTGITLTTASNLRSGIATYIDSTEGGDPVETHAVPIQKEDGTWDLSGVPSESRPFYESVLKQADETKAELAATTERLQKSEEKAVILADTLKTRELIQKAETEYGKVGPAEDVAQILKSAQENMDEETFEKFEQVLKSAQAKIDTGDLFTELGRAGAGAPLPPSSAEAIAKEKAEEIVQKGEEGVTLDIAMGRVWEENPDLYNKYQQEKARQWATPEGMSVLMTGGQA